MNLYRVYPESAQSDLATPAGVDLAAQWFAPNGSERVRWAMVAQPDGTTVDENGSSGGLSSPVDRAVLSILRDQADAVVTGARSVRAEPVPIPALAPLVIVSATGDLSGHQIIESSFRPDGVLVVTPPHTAAEPQSFFPHGVARHEQMPASNEADVADSVLNILSSLGLERVLGEGGLKLASLFLDARAVDELVLTLTRSPRVDSHPPLPSWDSQWGQWSASAVFTDDQRYLYTRYHRGQSIRRD